MQNINTSASHMKDIMTTSNCTGKEEHCSAGKTLANIAEDNDSMNKLNETLRILRVQIAAEKRQAKPDLEKLRLLRLEEEKCLEQIRS